MSQGIALKDGPHRRGGRFAFLLGWAWTDEGWCNATQTYGPGWTLWITYGRPRGPESYFLCCCGAITPVTG